MTSQPWPQLPRSSRRLTRQAAALAKILTRTFTRTYYSTRIYFSGASVFSAWLPLEAREGAESSRRVE